uniref:hypothetical protein n=1 Tax=Prevotella sp. TaxID=59823 RepID=UPI0040262736
MKTRIRLILTLVITFLFAFTSSASARCEANGNKASSAPCKAEAPENQQAKRNYQLGHNELDAEYKAIELHDVFMMNGRKYHLLFVRPTYYAKGKVETVYIYPDGFKSWQQNGLMVYLPKVTEFIVHNVPGQELWGSVIIWESTHTDHLDGKKHDKIVFTDTYTDVRLPDGPAQKILDLIQDNSTYEYTKSSWEARAIKYNRVETAELRKTKIRKDVNGKVTYEYTNQRKF